jgi:hypothetical protein
VRLGTQFLVTPSEIILGNSIEVAERRRQAVAAMLFRHPAQRPQRVLQALGQRHKTLAAEHHMGMLEARERQPEVIKAGSNSSPAIVMPSPPCR